MERLGRDPDRQQARQRHAASQRRQEHADARRVEGHGGHEGDEHQGRPASGRGRSPARGGRVDSGERLQQQRDRGERDRDPTGPSNRRGAARHIQTIGHPR